MPLFRRSDGVPIPDLPAVRRVMPYLMTSKAESLVLHDAVYDLSRTRAWLKAYNRAHSDRATLFHLFAYACTRALHLRPDLNRFVSGGRIYQRIAGYDVAKEIRSGNLAAGTALGQQPKGMDALECIHTRRSVRKFLDKPVGDDLVKQLLEAAMTAPSVSSQISTAVVSRIMRPAPRGWGCGRGTAPRGRAASWRWRRRRRPGR